MDFSYYDLGHRSRGDQVEVTLKGSAANVLLLDSSNYSAFKAGRQHRYQGGLAKRSPVVLTIPHTGRWYVVIHMAGLSGTVRHSIRDVPQALPEMRYGQPADISTLIRDVAEDDPDHPRPAATREHDVFISHASKDKQGIVSDLVSALQGQGVEVWYDAFELKPGDSLRRKIDEGLTRSRFGLVVVSRNFFEGAWAQQETRRHRCP